MSTLGDRVRETVRAAVRPLCWLFEPLGIHITPAHFYSPIPTRHSLPDDLFGRVSECVGVDWNVATQRRYLRDVFAAYGAEVAFEANPGLSLVDAAVLHSMIRHHKPRKMVEIGSGWSTRIAARACVMNGKEGRPCHLTAIEPHPARALKEGFAGLSELVEKRVEEIAPERLGDADLLFIDSSHVVRTGGDVTWEILEIVPRLRPGALVHWHDILLPGEYWKDWVKDNHLFWTEQYLLQAFLQFNRAFEIVWASRYMHLTEPGEIQKVLPFFRPEAHRITGFWVRRKE